VAHHLHCPSSPSKQVGKPQTADLTYQRIEWVTQQPGFNVPEMLIFDHLARREVYTGFSHYPRNILEHHEAFLYGFRDATESAVEVVYGLKVKNRMLKTMNLQELQLWGEHQQVSLFLEWTSKDLNIRKISRIIVFVHHPEYFLGYTASTGFKVLQDHKMFIIGRLARIQTNPTFFQHRKFVSAKQFRDGHSMTVYRL
jgi:hypothetical protein